MLTRRACYVFFIKAFVHFKYNIDIDLDFYARVLTCVKRATGKQPLERKCGRDSCLSTHSASMNMTQSRAS